MESRSSRHAVRKKQQSRRYVILALILIAAVAGFLYMRNEKNSITEPAPEPTNAQSANEGQSTVSPDKNLPAASQSSNISPPASPVVTSSPAPGNGTANGQNSQAVSLAFVGDVLLGSTVEKNILNTYGYDHPYKNVLPYLQNPDITIANLETPITDKGLGQKKEYVYRSSPNTLPAFAAAGFDVVNLANNHVMDYGSEGLLDTFFHLKENNIQYVGAGKDATEANTPVIIEKKGLKIAILGYSYVVPNNAWKAGANHPGVADLYNPNISAEAIKDAKTKADLVIVIAHWGVERTDKPEKRQVDMAHRMIDAGADLVIGGHPHVLQGFENYNGKWINYSLGNFIFTTNNVRETLDSMVLQANCTKGGCSLQVVPVFTQWAQPAPMNAEDGSKLYDRLSSISYRSKVNPDGNVVAQP